MVYVLNKSGKPLMPCSNVIARLLLKNKKAKVKSKLPFTIQMLEETTNHTQPLTHKLDTGSSKIGSAVTAGNVVVYMAEIEVRNDVSTKMTRRAMYRRNRRNRKTRYRPARFNNRKNSIRKDRFSPTMRSKIDSHAKEINVVRKILPITETIIETATFDPHALKNPEVLGNPVLYQKGINFGFANTKAYVLDRDNHECQNPKCKCKEKHPKLEVHHIVFRCNGGSDEADNLIVLCEQCHVDLHAEKISLKLSGKRKGNLRHATQMNSIRIQLLRRFPEAKETFGFVTKEYRHLLRLPKTHYFDAVAMGNIGSSVIFKTKQVFLKKCVSSGDYKMRQGKRSERVIPLGKLFGFRKFDKVQYKGDIYFIKGRWSTGYAYLMNINGDKIVLKPLPKFVLMKRISARKSWLIDVKIID